MPFSVSCPECRYSFRVPDSAAGQRGKCPKCKATFLAQRPSDAAPATAPAATATAVESTTKPRTLSIPKPRFLEKFAPETPPVGDLEIIEAAPSAAEDSPKPPLASPPLASPPPAPPAPARGAPPKAAAKPESPALVVEPAQKMNDSGAASVYGHRRAKKSSLPLLISLAGVALLLLVAVGVGIGWSMWQSGDEVAQLDRDASDNEPRERAGSESLVSAGQRERRAENRPQPHDDMPPATVGESEDFRRPSEDDKPGDDRGPSPSGEEKPFNPFAPPPTEDEQFAAALAKLGELRERLTAQGWRPKNEADYLNISEFAHQATELTARVDRLPEAEQAEPRGKITAAIEALADAPWPNAEEIAQVNKLAAADLAGRDTPGFFAYGRCILRPEDFGANSIDGLPIFAFELPGTEALVVLPIGENGADIAVGSEWLILGTKDLTQGVQMTTPGSPDPRDAMIVRAKFILRRS